MDDAQHKVRVQQQFGGSAEAYVRSATHAGGDDLEQLVAWAEGGPDRVALDVATGGGHTALALAPFFGRVVATDLTPRMLESAEAHARQRGVENVEFRVADAEDLPFDDDGFDLVSCRIAPHHFPNVARFVRDVARVLKPGGVFLLEDSVAPEDDESTLFLNRVEWLRDGTHVRTLSESEWTRIVTRAGFAVEDARRHRKPHPFEEWVERSRTPEENRQELLRLFRAANPVTRQALVIETDTRGNVVSFADEKLLLKARKLGPTTGRFA